MATLSVTKPYKVSGGYSANLVFTFTYTISDSDSQTTLTPSSLTVAKTQSGSAPQALQDQAKQLREAALQNGVAATVAFAGTTFINITVHSDGNQSISLSARNVTKTHSAQTKNLVLTGSDISKTASIAVPARTSYTVTFNANGGTGGLASDTKWYGETLTLPTTNLPSKNGYHFKGWGTSSSSTTTQSTYTGNAATTFYAVWEAWISSANIVKFDTLRVNDTSSIVEDDEGTVCYGTVEVNVSGAAAADISYSATVSPSGPSITLSKSASTKSANSTLNDMLTFYATGCAIEETYAFTVAAEITNTSSTQTAIQISRMDSLSPAYYPMDVLGDAYWDYDTQTGERPGHGIAFGCPSKTEGFVVNMPKFLVSCMAGVIQMFAGPNPPAGWLLCDGSAVSRTEYATLFAAIGTTWGTGDGSTTFNLPDLRGRAPIGAGQGSGLTSRSLGTQNIGEEAHTLSVSEMPAHSHAPQDDKGGFLVMSMGSSIISGAETTSGFASGGTGGFWGNTNKARKGRTGPDGGGGSHNNMQPSAVVNFIICTGKTY